MFIHNRLLIFIFFSICCIACDKPQIPSDGEKLSGGYFFRVEGSVYLRADNIFKPSIYGDITACSYNDDYIILLQKPNKNNYIINIAEELMSFRELLSRDSTKCSSEEFEFYKQATLDNKELFKVLFVKLSPNHDEKDIEKSKLIADSLVENNLFYISIFKNEINYWIISHKEINLKSYMPMSNVYGPFKREAYLQKREELGVPKELQLKE